MKQQFYKSGWLERIGNTFKRGAEGPTANVEVKRESESEERPKTPAKMRSAFI